MKYINILSDFCNSNNIQRVFSFLGQIYKILGILVPIIIIIMGSIDLVKVISSGNIENSKKAQKLFVKRIIYGILIFFIFPIVNFLINMLGEDTNNSCFDCFLNPNNIALCNYTNKNLDTSSIKNENECNNLGAPYIWIDNSCVIDLSEQNIDY